MNPIFRTTALAAFTLSALALVTGCRATAVRIAMPFLYREASLPVERVRLDVPYWSALEADPEKHRLDLFLPEAEPGWPVLVFVHGGGWRTGDRAYEEAGADVYRNIGRFLASRGVGVASISYRLQPGVDWRAQVTDVARALHWVQTRIGEYGGNPRGVFLSGHSAGAQLAAHVALGTAAELPGSPRAPFSVCGLIPVSGAGFDLTDATTYTLGADPDYYGSRFGAGDGDGDWQRAASPIARVDAAAPPTLILYAGGESAALQHQAQLLDRALRKAGVRSEVVIVPGEDHERMVLTLSRPDKTSAPAILDFIDRTSCGL